MLIDRQLFRFFFVGILNTIASYLIFVIIYFLIENKEISVSISFFLSVLFNYYTISSYVFQSARSAKKLINFFAIYLLLYFINIIHLWIAVDIYYINVYLAQFLILFYLPIFSYLLSKRYVFNHSEN